MKKIIPIIFCLFLINFTLLTAISISYPHAFHGTAKYRNGGNIPDGYIVTGEVNGVITGSCEVIDGKYDLVVVDEIGDGGEVKFYIQGEEADQTSDFIELKATELDLTIDSDSKVDDEFCGDGSCNNGETSSSCSIDCDDSSSNTNSGGNNNNGGGGGGGYPLSNQITQTTNSDGTVNLDFETIDKLNNASENHELTSSGFTGSVIGFVKSSGGIATGIILLVGLIGAFAFFNLKKRKSVKNDSEKENNSEEI